MLRDRTPTLRDEVTRAGWRLRRSVDAAHMGADRPTTAEGTPMTGYDDPAANPSGPR
jgi:hypothetical protein